MDKDSLGLGVAESFIERVLGRDAQVLCVQASRADQTARSGSAIYLFVLVDDFSLRQLMRRELQTSPIDAGRLARLPPDGIVSRTPAHSHQPRFVESSSPAQRR